jgi:hypothetical protein
MNKAGVFFLLLFTFSSVHCLAQKSSDTSTNNFTRKRKNFAIPADNDFR